MTYGRVLCAAHAHNLTDAAVSHWPKVIGRTGEGESFLPREGPLIRPFGPPSPQGEKATRDMLWSPTAATDHDPVRPKRFT